MAEYKSGHKFPTMITPRGVASLVHLAEEDPRYGGYKVTVLLDKKDIPPGRIAKVAEDVEGKAWVRHIQGLAKEVGAASKVNEEGFFIKDGDKKVNKDGEPYANLQGKLLLQFKTKLRPKIGDSRGVPLPRGTGIRAGDEIRVAFRPAFIEVNGKKYLTMYLNEVRLMAQRADDTDWGEEDGYVVPEGASAGSDTEAHDNYDDDDAGTDF